MLMEVDDENQQVPELLSTIKSEYLSLVEASKKLAHEKSLYEKKLIDHTIEVTKMNSIFFDLKAKHDAMKIVYERENQTLRQLLSDHNIAIPDIDYQRLFEQQYSRLTGRRRRLQLDGARVVRDPYSVTCFAADGRSPVPLPRRARPSHTADVDGWCLGVVEPEALFSHDGVVTTSCFSRGAGVLAVGYDECVRLYDVMSGEQIIDFIQASPAMHPDQQVIPHFAPAPSAGLRPLDISERQNQRGAVRAVDFSRDDEYLFVGSESAFVTVYDLHTARPVLTLEGHTEPVFSVACTPKTNHLATAGADGRILIWKISPSGTPARDPAVMSGRETGDVNMDDSLSAGVTACSRRVRPRLGLGVPPSSGLLAPTGGVVNPNVAPVPTKEEKEMAISAADGVVSFRGWIRGSSPNSVVSSSVPSSSLSRGIGELDELQSISSVKWLNENTLTFAGQEGAVSVADLETGAVVRKWSSHRAAGHANAVFNLTVSPDEKTIVSASLDTTIKVWDPRQASAVATLTGHRDYVLTVAVSPDNRFLVSGSKDRTVTLWVMNDWTRYCSIRGHNNSVLTVGCSSDGELMCSGGGDGKVRLWRYGYEGDALANLA